MGKQHKCHKVRRPPNDPLAVKERKKRKRERHIQRARRNKKSNARQNPIQGGGFRLTQDLKLSRPTPPKTEQSRAFQSSTTEGKYDLEY
jgi:hypothetical protein